MRLRAGLLHSLLEAAAEGHPDRLAAVGGDRSLTYAELCTRARQLAHLLSELGVVPGDRVGIHLGKQLEAVVAVYGVLAAGAAYVPLDPQAPPARLCYLVSDCGVRVVLAGQETVGPWSAPEAAGVGVDALVVLDTEEELGRPASGPAPIAATALDAQPTTPPKAAVSTDGLAYVLYTSGSTGVPKGVMLSHANALGFVDWAGDRFGVGPADRLSNHAPLHFDLSVFDLFAAARGAAAVVPVPPVVSMFPRELARFVNENAISVWYSVPTVLSMLALRGGLSPGDLPSVRAVLFAGEVFPTKHLRLLQSLLPRAQLANLYGPTETNVCTWYPVPQLPADQTAPIPIGRAIDGVDVFPVDDDGRAAPRGEVGELCVSGPTVMGGYWGDPDRSAQVLVPDPRAGRSGVVYRTGDLVREREDGDYEFLGRRDEQVKSRGYRIELGDVESALVAHPAIVECAVVAVPDELVGTRLRAYAVLRGDVADGELARFCAARLPPYMIPESIVARGSLPRTSTGKVDRRALLDKL
jgi:amino acid adenylation domain-containing protein